MQDGQNHDSPVSPSDAAEETGVETSHASLERASDASPRAEDASNEMPVAPKESSTAETEASSDSTSIPEALDAGDHESAELGQDEEPGETTDALEVKTYANEHDPRGPEAASDAEALRIENAEVLEMSPDYVADMSFEDLELPPTLLEGILARGYTRPTPVQAAAYPLAMEGRDLIVRSKTGTGKTAAFMLPILAQIPAGTRKTRAIVLAPTRELAIQVADEGIALAQYKDISVVPIYGGVGFGLQNQQLESGAEVVVGTPGRLLDHIRRGNLDLSGAQFAVLDEADEMLSMGFLEEVKEILRRSPEGRQTFLFSATVDPAIAGLINDFMTNPEEILLSTDVRTVDHIRNILYECSDLYPKARSLLYTLYLESPESAIIFCNTRDDCSFVASYLTRQGFEAEFINSDLPQRERERVMGRLKKGQLSFLVATDIAARGIDISDLTHVINYSLPEDPDLYLHRVGRTGRIGKLGTAVSLVSGRDLTAELALTHRLNVPFERKMLPSAEEAARLWTEKHMVSLQEASKVTAYEGFLPMAKAMRSMLSEEELERTMATALRVFFAWYKSSRLNPNASATDVEEQDEALRDHYREGPGRGGERSGRREARDRDGRGRGGRGREGRESRGRGRELRESRGRGRGRDDRDRGGRERDRGGRERDRREGPRGSRSGEGHAEDGRRREGRGGSRSDSRPEARSSDGRGNGARRREERSPERGRGGRSRSDSRGGRSRDRGRGHGRRSSVETEGVRSAMDSPEGARAPESAVANERPPKPLEDLFDPLAAFAAANDLDLESWIESEDVESDSSRRTPDGAEGERGEQGEAGGEGRRRRRGSRRRRRGPRRSNENRTETGESSEQNEALAGKTITEARANSSLESTPQSEPPSSIPESEDSPED